MEYVVEMLHISKFFPGIKANADITLQLAKGEIHALLGENGAGKSTLMSILFGLYQPDEGELKICGKAVRINDPNVANDLGIGMVHQHFKLVPNFTVTENIVLGREPTGGPFLNVKNAAEKIRFLSEKYGLNVQPDAKIEDISVGMQQRVEILKMLYRDADVLIFDEPTAVLTPQEIEDFIRILKSLKAEGKSIILITHKLKEIKAIADRCTIIRQGELVDTVSVPETSEEKMAELMVGRKVFLTIEKKKSKPGEAILEIENLFVKSARKVPAVKNFSLCVHAGEIVGLAGVDGNGQTELIEALTGLRPIESGSILLNGTEISRLPVRGRVEKGLAHIPEDRQKRGLVLDYNIEENLILHEFRAAPFSRYGFMDRKAIAGYAQGIIRDFDVRSPEGATSIVRTMSGGNQQKAIVGREFSLHPDLLVAVQPTRGLDVGSTEYIHRRIVELRDAGKAVLLVSLELDEILGLSDKIAVISHGELIDVADAASVTEKQIGLMMAGVRRNHDVA